MFVACGLETCFHGNWLVMHTDTLLYGQRWKYSFLQGKNDFRHLLISTRKVLFMVDLYASDVFNGCIHWSECERCLSSPSFNSNQNCCYRLYNLLFSIISLLATNRSVPCAHVWIIKFWYPGRWERCKNYSRSNLPRSHIISMPIMPKTIAITI